MKYYLLTLLFIALFAGAFWAFNHINAWIGVIAFLTVVGILIKTIKQQTK